jgi:hypothetical protein
MVTVTLYCPVAAVVVLIMLGFCSVLVNKFGPVQLQVDAPAEVVDALRFRLLPLHKGLTFGMVGVAGFAVIVIVVFTFTAEHPLPAGKL